jgi:hypothetical protein
VTWDLSYKIKYLKYIGPMVRYFIKGVGIPQSGQVILLTNKNLFYDEHNLLLPTGSYCRVSDGDFVANSPLLLKTLDNDDIVQGIPKIEQLLKLEKTFKMV